MSAPHHDDGRLLDNMPVYRSRIDTANAVLETGAPLDLDEFFMHYTVSSATESAMEFLDGCVSVLDIGCGFGASLIWMAQRSEEVRALAGVDLLPANIQVARGLSRRLLADDYRLSFFSADVSTLDAVSLGDGCGIDEVDGVLCLNMLMHLTEAQRLSLWDFIQEILTVSGRVFIEDIYRLRQFDDDESTLLREQLACPWLPDKEAFISELTEKLSDAVVIPDELSLAYALHAEKRYQGYDGADETRREYLRAMSVLLGDGALGAMRVRVEQE